MTAYATLDSNTQIVPARTLLRRQEKNKVHAILKLATSQERQKLKSLYMQASKLAGNLWNADTHMPTCDEGIQESAKLFSEYRILLANIAHREGIYGKR